ncbi:TRAP transporter substrate-binding protein [Cohaesibacter gelatinilyticus]|uniref:Tripartite ATP-independent transporter solute receptor, DctP family n=1 Tax=Cohaesibacter gelatinilyticus TaxID=372072 RepID=A0A285NC61_9HYPH|nr:TRAP transporter substrate-binding protein [Cohaesibacter gelatinilyticus]SNZ07045.1 tripartite ATP-independent transporter solute receptor, DctP family [Cohaesibacter gelatinilyticus]HAT87491.1 TRAP transporter substrate-binding protein [Hyphomicrobiales bacterium]
MKLMKLGTAAGAILVALASLASAAELRGWNTHVPDYPVSVAMDKFGELVAQRTEGRVKPKTYHSAQLGEQDDAIEQMQFGGLDFAVFNLVPLNNLVPATQATTLPYAFKSIDHMHRVMDGNVGEVIGKHMEDVNMVALAWYDSGARSFYANKPLKSLADLKGLKIRVQNSDVNVAMVEALGGNATPIPFGEVFTSIQSGVVDGAENNWPSYESTGHFEVARHYLLDQHTIVPEVFAINKTTWDKLSGDDQKIVRQAAIESATLQRKLWAEREAKSEKIVRDAGNTIVELEDKSDFIAAMKPVYDKFATNAVVSDILKQIQAVK